MVCKGKSSHPNAKPPWNVLKVVGWWPARCYFIVVAPSSCRMGQSLWMCCSQPQPQPIRCWPGALWKEHTSCRTVMCHSSGHFCRVENPHLESWSPGSEQPMAGRSHHNPLCSGDSDTDACQWEQLCGAFQQGQSGSEPRGDFQYRRYQNLPGSHPAMGTSRQDNGKARSLPGRHWHACSTAPATSSRAGQSTAVTSGSETRGCTGHICQSPSANVT